MSSYDPFNKPSSGGGGGGGPRRPTRDPVEELTRNFKNKGGSFLTMGLLLLGVVAVMSSFYTVDAGHVGVVLRFGEHIDTTKPGLHFKVPFGVDRVQDVAVERQQKMEFGFRTAAAGVQSTLRRDGETVAESDMLTGDLNVAKVEWIIQYVIKTPEKYLFQFRDIETTLRLMAEATMRSVTGDYSFDEVITDGREEVERRAKELLVDLNKRYDTGIDIQQLKLRDVNASIAEVQDALRDVESAKQERERMKKQAMAAYNKVVPRARGEAMETIERAKAYSIDRVNRAQGEANRFKALHEAYRRAPEVTRTRLYIESMDRVLPKAKRKVVVDSKTKGLLPLLHLNEGGIK
ncbi:MAG: FtsH protease activity modulator HflK [Deltaproteobacteria bacterium]|nr:FtsH protease activity modulator HflK [Deltaproteobacteria bacterium]MBT6436263.1 FtsH protease activity modulator HflK [Deltaproteobacteria bacterium]MBT6492400.1 FtsH protease activity modulator HflK [Deltaproteobacteria bacterium]